jgi:tetratricopeptide (TPR) repeat protein
MIISMTTAQAENSKPPFLPLENLLPAGRQPVHFQEHRMAKRSRKTKRPAEAKRTGTTAKPSRPGFSREWLWAALLFAAVVLAYSPVWWAGYVWDDDFMLTSNPRIIGPEGLAQIWTTTAADICPLTFTTFWLGHAIWGLDPLPYHLVNVALHGLSAIVLWRVLRKLRVPGAWLGAALWALHPVNVESVAWIAEMKNAQSGLFFLLSILFFLKSLRQGEGTTRITWTRNDAIFLICAALAMASKSSTVVLPVVLGLCAWWVEGRWIGSFLVKLALVFLLSVAAALLTLWTQQWTAVADLPYSRTWPERLITAADATWFYLGKLLWPHPLIPVYPLWKIDATQVISYLPLLAAIALAVVLWLKRTSWSRPFLFAFAFFGIALLPVVGLVTNSFARYSFVADHFQYLAAMGPLALAGALLVTATNRLFPGKQMLATLLATGLLFTVGTVTWCQAWNYETQEKMWTETLRYNPECWEALTNLGNSLIDRDKAGEAIPLFQRALAVNPHSAILYYNLGLALSDQGQVAEAQTDYEHALKIYPDYAVAHNGLGCLLLDQGKLDEAAAHFQSAILGNPNFAAAHYNLGRVHAKRAEDDAAIAEFRQAVGIRPGYAAAQFALGQFLMKSGQVDEGVSHLQAAVASDPDDDQIQCALGVALMRKGQLSDALPCFQHAHEINPRNEQADYNLGRILLQFGRVDEGIGYSREALALNPRDAQAHNNLGVALAQKGLPADAIPEFRAALQLAPGYVEAQKNLELAQAQAAKRTNP